MEPARGRRKRPCLIDETVNSQKPKGPKHGLPQNKNGWGRIMYYFQRFRDRYVYGLTRFPTLYHQLKPHPFGHTQ